MKLLGSPASPYTRKVRVVLAEKRIECEMELARIHRGPAAMAKDLEGKPWCHNDRYSLADIAVGCCLGWLDFRKPGDVNWHAEYSSLAQHYRKLMERSAFVDSVPQVPKA